LLDTRAQIDSGAVQVLASYYCTVATVD